MEIVQSILKKGNVYIAARCPPLLVATFISISDSSKVTVDSDRGIAHLLMLLVGKVSSNILLVNKANETYQNSLSITNTCEKVRVLEFSYTKFSYNEKGYRVSLKQILVPQLSATPGIYRRRAYGATLEEAFTAAVNVTPELLL
jgi:hypothetical protein